MGIEWHQIKNKIVKEGAKKKSGIPIREIDLGTAVLNYGSFYIIFFRKTIGKWYRFDFNTKKDLEQFTFAAGFRENIHFQKKDYRIKSDFFKEGGVYENAPFKTGGRANDPETYRSIHKELSRVDESILNVYKVFAPHIFSQTPEEIAAQFGDDIEVYIPNWLHGADKFAKRLLKRLAKKSSGTMRGFAHGHGVTGNYDDVDRIEIWDEGTIIVGGFCTLGKGVYTSCGKNRYTVRSYSKDKIDASKHGSMQTLRFSMGAAMGDDFAFSDITSKRDENNKKPEAAKNNLGEWGLVHPVEGDDTYAYNMVLFSYYCSIKAFDEAWPVGEEELKNTNDQSAFYNALGFPKGSEAISITKYNVDACAKYSAFEGTYDYATRCWSHKEIRERAWFYKGEGAERTWWQNGTGNSETAEWLATEPKTKFPVLKWSEEVWETWPTPSRRRLADDARMANLQRLVRAERRTHA